MLAVDTASDIAVREKFGDYCASVENGGRALVITRVGRPGVVMLSMADYEAIMGHGIRGDGDRAKKIRAYEAMEAMKRRSPFPKDYDYDAARAEAFSEKYTTLSATAPKKSWSYAPEIGLEGM